MPNRDQPDLFLGHLQGTEVSAEKRQGLWLSDNDCKTGLHVIGAPNTGKSKFLEHLIRQDVRRGYGLCLIDPHAELYNDILEWCSVVDPTIPVIPLNLSTGEHVIGFNPFIRTLGGDIATQADRCLSAAVKAWGAEGTDQSPRLERVMRSLFHAIIESSDLSLCEAEYFVTYANARERAYLVDRIGTRSVRGTWQDIARLKRFEDFSGQVDSTRNRLSRFNDAIVARRFLALTDPRLNLDFGRLMDSGAILLVNIHPSGNLSEQNMRLLGSFLVSSFIQHGSRRNPKTARPFTLYLDEFYNFVPPDLGQALPQLRKFNVRFVLAHQVLSQLRKEDATILDEVLGCVKARVVFGGLQYADALLLASEMFAGQTDYADPKYWHETVKFWPVYDRDSVHGRGLTHSNMRARGKTIMESATDIETHTDAAGSASQSAEANSRQGSMGMSIPYMSGVAGGDGTMHFDSSGWGLVTSAGGSESNMSADTSGHARTRGLADSASEGEGDALSMTQVDVPIYRPVAMLERTPEFHSLEEQRDRQAALLMLQYQRHGFVHSPGRTTRPFVVPFVERHPQSGRLVREYEHELAKKVGALTPAEVDEVIAQRQRLIEHQAREFANTQAHPVDSDEHEPQRSTATTPKRMRPNPTLNPAAGRKKTPTEGTSGPEG